MTTCADLINQTEQHLLAGDRETLNRVTSTVQPTDLTVAFDFQPEMIQGGSYVAVDLEIMYVWSMNGNTATVQRGMLGSTAATHQAGTLAYANPRFSKFAIFNALNAEINDLSGPPNGLFQPKNFQVTTFPVQRTYAVPVTNNDLIDILDIRYQPPTPEFHWPRLDRWQYDLLRDMPTGELEQGIGDPTSGMWVRLETPVYPGRVMNIVYSAPFTMFAALTDDAQTATGLPVSALDIPPLGAAARLMGVREAKRAFTESEVDTRRAAEVPVGAASKAAQTLLALLNERIKTEFTRLMRQYPDRM